MLIRSRRLTTELIAGKKFLKSMPLAALKNKNGHLILWNDLQIRYFNYNNR